MTYQEVVTMLQQTGLPVTYYQWEESVPSLPYLVFYYPYSNNAFADDSVFKRVDRLNVELYTKRKSMTDEENLEAVLDDWNMTWQKSETYLDSEKMYEVLYEMEIIVNG